MNESEELKILSHTVHKRWLFYLLNVEGFLIGTLFFCLFIVTFSIWALERWSQGQLVLVLAAATGMLIVTGTFFYATQHKQRLLAFASILTVAGAIYMLKPLGVFG